MKKATWTTESGDGFRVLHIKNKPGYAVVLDGDILVAEVEIHDMKDLKRDLEDNESLCSIASLYTKRGRFCWYCEDIEAEEAHLYIEREEE